MILERLYEDKLAQASYLIGCAATGEAVVVDPNRDIAAYLRLAAKNRVRITHVTETHIHADYVSGSRELAARTGARLLLSDEGGEGWRYGFDGDAGATLLRDGDHFMIGNVRFDVLHTPGHTPEHVSFLVTDTAGADRPIGILTGDFLFVGDVGRPDLLEKAAGFEGTMDAAARTLFRSLRRLEDLPDYLQIWPGHGAGSACGKGLSSIPHSTLGYERLFNWALATGDEAEFVAGVLAGQPEVPKYFARMKQVNRDGPAILDGFRRPDRLPPDRLPELLDGGQFVVDARPGAAFAAGHVPGTLSIPFNRSFITWAGWLVPEDRDVWLLFGDAGADATAAEAARDLAMIGIDRVAGFLDGSAIDAWKTGGRRLGRLDSVTAGAAQPLLDEGGAVLLDVRPQSEWDDIRIPGAMHVPLGFLPDRAGEVPRDRPVVVHCRSGSRSVIAASVLLREGHTDVRNLEGGWIAWGRAGGPLERSEAAVPGAA